MTLGRVKAVVAASALATAVVMTQADAAVCGTDFDCGSASFPVCISGTCSAGPTQCVSDDAGDSGNGDDGPVVARSLQPTLGTPASSTGAICGTPSYEADWYKTTVIGGSGLTLAVSWTGSDNLDLAAFDSSGRLQGYSLHQSPESVSLTYLPAGTYYVRVINSTLPPSANATPYQIDATLSAAQVCANSTDCAAMFSTQLFRSVCQAGSCRPQLSTGLPLGSACDGNTECSSGLCSYVSFESGADRSVCTAACTTDSDCATVGAGFHCTQGFVQNRCEPSCANDLQCGADTPTSAVTLGQPWLYYTCTAGAACLNDRIFAGTFEIGG